jgi:hypothetical protein
MVVRLLIVFPWGTEESVSSDIAASVDALQEAFGASGRSALPIVTVGPMAAPPTIPHDLSFELHPAANAADKPAPREKSVPQRETAASCAIRGSVTLEVSFAASPLRAGAIPNEDLLFIALLAFELHKLRSVDRVLLHLVSCACLDSPGELAEPLQRASQDIRRAARLAGLIRSVPSQLWDGGLSRESKVASLDDDNNDNTARPVSHLLRRHVSDVLYTSILPQSVVDSDDDEESSEAKVLYRVSAVRRNQTEKKKFTSLDLERAAGFAVGEKLWPFGWRASMQFFNTELVVVHDTDIAQIGLSVFHPPLPRAGRDTSVPLPVVTAAAMPNSSSPSTPLTFHADPRTDFLFQLGLGLQRQRLGKLLLTSLKEIGSGIRSSASGGGDDTDDPAYLLLTARCKGLMPHPSTFKHDFRTMKGQNAMNPALARCLLFYLRPSAGDVVLDPLCGSGTVLLEAWLMLHGQVHLIGGDLSREECFCCSANLQSDALGEGLRVYGLLAGREEDRLGLLMSSCACDPLQALDKEALRAAVRHDAARTPLGMPGVYGGVVQWNAGRMPLRSYSVDRIVSDLPFGRRCGNHLTNSRLYPLLLAEFARVLTPKDRQFDDADSAPSHACCVLLTIERRVMLEALGQQRYFRLLGPPVCMDMGGLCPYAFVLGRS